MFLFYPRNIQNTKCAQWQWRKVDPKKGKTKEKKNNGKSEDDECETEVSLRHFKIDAKLKKYVNARQFQVDTPNCVRETFKKFIGYYVTFIK